MQKQLLASFLCTETESFSLALTGTEKLLHHCAILSETSNHPLGPLYSGPSWTSL